MVHCTESRHLVLLHQLHGGVWADVLLQGVGGRQGALLLAGLEADMGVPEFGNGMQACSCSLYPPTGYLKNDDIKFIANYNNNNNNNNNNNYNNNNNDNNN